MALSKIKLDEGGEWPGGSILVFGPYAVGKTDLLGDMLASEQENGKVMYANMKGEDGWATLRNKGLKGDVIYDITSLDEFNEFLDLAEKEKPRAIAGDSLKWLYELAKYKKTGGKRPPITGDFKTNEYPEIQLWLHQAMTRARRVAKHVVFTCPADIAKDTTKEAETGVEQAARLTPDMGGKMDFQCMTWFDLAGYLTADTKQVGGKPVTERRFTAYTTKRVLARQRGIPLKEDVLIPEGPGGWKVLLTAINKAYQGGA